MISIIYATCSMYKSLWAPFFKLKDKYMDKTIPIYLCTDVLPENKLSEDCNVLIYGHKSDTGIRGNYFDRYLHHLENIHTKYIVFLVDDMFPLAPVSTEALNECTELMNEDESIKVIKLSTHSAPCSGAKVNYKGRDFIQADNARDEYIISLQPTLIRRDFFIDMLNYCKVHNTLGHQNGGLEIHGTHYFRNSDYRCLRVCEDIFKVNYAGGIVQSGFISDDTRKLLLTEDIVIETFGNNLIFTLTEDEYSLAGGALRDEFARRGVRPEKSMN